MTARIDVVSALRRGLARATESWQPVALAAVAAALAWLIAHRLLGHPQPFFAPIAAAIALSTSWIQRARRTVQMVVGVLLGIGIGEGLVAAFGTSTVALGVIVFVTMSAARFTGGGFFGEGMMFANQAAASAILVLTLHRHGTGGERVLDAIVGGAVAFALGVVLFPAHPLAILATAERSMLRVLADTLDRVATRIATGTAADDEWALRAGQQIHRQLAALAQAR
ncbi:MAG: FUSC family protein, partial [Solirubrobacteraceae bacterium]